MESRYTSRDVDLSLLSKWVERFFEKKSFTMIKEDETIGYRIIARPSYVHDIIGKVTVVISGNSNDFVVEFFSGMRSSALTKIGRLTTFFGGGILFLKGVKSQEAEEKLERNFWIYVDEKINILAGPANRQRSEKKG